METKKKPDLAEFIRSSFTTDERFWQNEIHANRLVARTLLLSAFLLILSCILNEIGVYNLAGIDMRGMTVQGLLELLVPYGICTWFKGEKRWLKYLMMVELTIVYARLDCALSFDVMFVMLIPVVLSCRYFSRAFTIQIIILTTFLFAASAFFGAYLGLSRINLLYYKEGTVAYTINIMTRSFMPKWLLFVLISTICTKIAQNGKQMVLDQDAISREHSRVEAELDMARRIQLQALPIVHSLEASEERTFELAADMIPAKEVGGDFYDFFFLDPTHLALMIADVSGKGVPAALFMMVSKLLLDNSVTSGKTPGQVLAEVNHQLCEKGLEDMFVTVWLGILDLETGTVTTANGGHEYPLIRRKDGSFELYKDKHGLVLGGVDGVRYRECQFNLEPGDVLFVYTDGVPEANDPNQQLFGMDRTIASLNSHKDEPVEQLIHSVKADVDAFSDTAPQFDDTTMLAIRLNSYMSREGICVKPTRENIAEVEDYIRSIMEAAEVAMKPSNRMNVAVDEIWSNITFYSGASWAQAICTVTDENVTVTMRDNGIPYDPFQAEDPDITLSAEERGIGGLGVYMTKKLMDSVSYKHENGYNVTTLMIHR